MICERMFFSLSLYSSVGLGRTKKKEAKKNCLKHFACAEHKFVFLRPRLGDETVKNAAQLGKINNS